LRTPAVLRRLGHVRAAYSRVFVAHDLVLSPVLGTSCCGLGT